MKLILQPLPGWKEIINLTFSSLTNHLKIILFLFLLFTSIVKSQECVPIVPEPRMVYKNSQKFPIKDSSISIETFLNNKSKKDLLIHQVEETFASVKGYDINKRSNYSKVIKIGLPSENKSFKILCEKNKFWPEKKIGKEGYVLQIKKDKIIIAANTYTGVFYGVQSLKQLIRSSKGSNYLPGLKIIDWPEFKYRGVLDDISRGPVPTISFMKYQIRRFSELKINFLQYYVENVVMTKSHPEFAPPDGSISIKEWKELAEYAKKYQIALIGNFQSFGHFEKILKTPVYSYLGESRTLLSPMRSASYKFLSDIYSEMVPAFNATIFNVDCDETFDLGKGRSKKPVDRLGYAEVYFRHVIKLHDILKKLKTKMMMWADIPLKYPVLLKKLPKDILLATWTYDDLNSYKKFILPIKKAGFKFFVTTGVINSDKIYPNYFQTFGNIKGFAKAGAKYGAEGVINSVWDGGGTALFSNDWYGIAYGADNSWNPYPSDSTCFDYRLTKGIYGSKNENFSKAIKGITELRKLEPTDGMTSKIQFENLIPAPGKSVRISLIGWKKVLSITNKAKKLLSKTNLNFYTVDKKYLSFTTSLYNSLAEERINLFNASNDYKEAYAVFYKDKSGARKLAVNAVKNLNNIINSYTILKNEYQDLWLKENHMYSLNLVTDNFQKKINDYTGIKNRVMNSLDSPDSGKSLLSAKDVRLSISKLPGKYFREWLMINPLPNIDEKINSEVDYLAGMGGENSAAPKVTREFYFDSLKYRWKRVITKYQDVVNLSEIFPGGNKYEVMYAFANIDVENDTTITALAGCAEGIAVFINSKKIFRSRFSKKLIPDEYKFKLPLKKGRNNLMLKISRTGEQWGFTFRLPGCKVRNHKNRYRIVK